MNIIQKFYSSLIMYLIKDRILIFVINKRKMKKKIQSSIIKNLINEREREREREILNQVRWQLRQVELELELELERQLGSIKLARSLQSQSRADIKLAGAPCSRYSNYGGSLKENFSRSRLMHVEYKQVPPPLPFAFLPLFQTCLHGTRKGQHGRNEPRERNSL